MFVSLPSSISRICFASFVSIHNETTEKSQDLAGMYVIQGNISTKYDPTVKAWLTQSLYFSIFSTLSSCSDMIVG